jgi:GNAT superfamily N-acetyltransferase
MRGRRLQLLDMDAAARVHRATFDHALPWLMGLHTPDQDRWFYRERVFTSCSVWGVFEAEVLTGIIAFREDWIDQLYVLPDVQGRGVGSQLLQVAQRVSTASSFGRFNATCRRVASTRREGLWWSKKPTAPITKRRSPTRAISGLAEAQAAIPAFVDRSDLASLRAVL